MTSTKLRAVDAGPRPGRSRGGFRLLDMNVAWTKDPVFGPLGDRPPTSTAGRSTVMSPLVMPGPPPLPLFRTSARRLNTAIYADGEGEYKDAPEVDLGGISTGDLGDH